jgi:hypothetical protein
MTTRKGMQKEWANMFRSGRETDKSHALAPGIDGRGTTQLRTWTLGSAGRLGELQQ